MRAACRRHAGAPGAREHPREPVIYAASSYARTTSSIGPQTFTLPASSSTPVAQMRLSSAPF